MIHLAIAAAESNVHYPKWRLGAVLVKGGSLLSTGRSRKTNDPSQIQDGLGCSIHAEQAALKAARKSNVSGSVMYVARIGRDGDIKLAKPCSECEALLRKAGVKKVVYTTEDGVEIERIVK